MFGSRENGKEKERKREKEAAGKLPPAYCISAVKSVFLFVQTEIYIDAQCKGSYKKNKIGRLLQGSNGKKPKAKANRV